MDTAHFAGVLAHRADQPVVDKTGLTGVYDFKLSYAPANDPSSSLPDFFTALKEQLGLKLESQKVPVEFLVIDQVDKILAENWARTIPDHRLQSAAAKPINRRFRQTTITYACLHRRYHRRLDLRNDPPLELARNEASQAVRTSYLPAVELSVL